MLIDSYLSFPFEKEAIFLAFLTLKNWDLLQNTGILRVKKNGELQIREIESRELQGLPVKLCSVQVRYSSYWIVLILKMYLLTLFTATYFDLKAHFALESTVMSVLVKKVQIISKTENPFSPGRRPLAQFCNFLRYKDG